MENSLQLKEVLKATVKTYHLTFKFCMKSISFVGPAPFAEVGLVWADAYGASTGACACAGTCVGALAGAGVGVNSNGLCGVGVKSNAGRLQAGLCDFMLSIVLPDFPGRAL
jgi:N-acetylmuramic acid 6-phosphate (MurNAc-6-P) etherase